MSERFGEVNQRIAAVRAEVIERIDAVRVEVGALRTAVRAEVIERIDAVRVEVGALRTEMSERIGHVEGLLQGIGFVLRKRGGKEHSDGEEAPPMLPRP